MDIILMNLENSKTSDPHIPLFNLSDRINLIGSDKYVALSNLSIYYTWKWKYIKKSCKSNEFTISAPAWNDEFKIA